LIKLDDRFVLEHSSLDGYLFLRFFRTIIFICFVGSCISWPILFPVNATGGGHGFQLDRFNLGNVRDPSRLWAHAVVAWLVYAFVMYVVARERLWLIGLRQAWHLSKANAARLSSRTVLYLNPPEDAPLNGDLRLNYGQEARRQWVVTATGALDRLVDDRDATAGDLESAQVSFLKKANKKWQKLAKKHGANATLPEQTVSDLRPVHKDLYIMGKSNDAISYLREELKKAEKKVDDCRKLYSTDSSRGRYAVFVEYESQLAAQRAYRANPKPIITVSRNISIPKKHIGVLPSEVLWNNVEMPQAMRISRKTAGNLFIAALIFFWSVLSAFVGSISNVHYLSDNFEWLHWIKDLPDPVLGLLTGLLPPLIASLLAAYVPIFMRRKPHVESSG
jgi:calcium permeable stress-gated cation channel